MNRHKDSCLAGNFSTTSYVRRVSNETKQTDVIPSKTSFSRDNIKKDSGSNYSMVIPVHRPDGNYDVNSTRDNRQRIFKQAAVESRQTHRNATHSLLNNGGKISSGGDGNSSNDVTYNEELYQEKR